MAESGPDLLAVYGTLRDAELRAEVGVEEDLELVGPCELEGLLLDCGEYPGLIEGSGTVTGALFRIRSEEVLDRLDRYEGYRPQAPGPSLFVRRAVELASPEAIAWTYWYDGPRKGRPLIESGNWSAHESD